jgi:hypothetical protein
LDEDKVNKYSAFYDEKDNEEEENEDIEEEDN